VKAQPVIDTSAPRQAAVTVHKLEVAANRARAKVANLDKRASDAAAERAVLEERVKDAAVNAMLADEPMPDADPALTEGLRRTAAQITAAQDARPIAVREVKAAEQALERARNEFAAEQKLLLEDLQESRRLTVVEKLAALAPDLAALAAMDSLHERFRGVHFAPVGGRLPSPPWSGKVSVGRLINGLVERLRPPQLAEAQFAAAVAAESAALSKILQELTK
jgi:hypothetical protein